jgi:hypothetical protein
MILWSGSLFRTLIGPACLIVKRRTIMHRIAALTSIAVGLSLGVSLAVLPILRGNGWDASVQESARHSASALANGQMRMAKNLRKTHSKAKAISAASTKSGSSADSNMPTPAERKEEREQLNMDIA